MIDNTVLIALIGIVPASLTAILGYLQGRKHNENTGIKDELRKKKITHNIVPNPNYKELVYENYAMSLMTPRSWSVEDGPAKLAGGEFNLVSRYEETKGAIGINFRLRPIQANYVNDIESQNKNQIETFQKNFPGATMRDKSISGVMGKLFEYEVATGKRRMKVNLYWIRLVPDVQLQIQAAQYTDAADTIEFWKQVDQVIDSIVIAIDAWHLRYNK